VARVGRALVRGDLPVRELRQKLGRGSLTVPGVPDSLARQAIRFGVVGVLSTLAYLLLFMLVRPLGAQPANLLALLVTAVANTTANRRFTFGVSGDGAARQQMQGLVVFALGLALTSGSLALLTDLVTHPARVLELSVLVAANLAATVLRFVLFREWVFARRTSSVTSPPEGTR
jgi:putative flippase GtrA